MLANWSKVTSNLFNRLLYESSHAFVLSMLYLSLHSISSKQTAFFPPSCSMIECYICNTHHSSAHVPELLQWIPASALRNNPSIETSDFCELWEHFLTTSEILYKSLWEPANWSGHDEWHSLAVSYINGICSLSLLAYLIALTLSTM